jgi:alpha,alpha-trehalase
MAESRAGGNAAEAGTKLPRPRWTKAVPRTAARERHVRRSSKAKSEMRSVTDIAGQTPDAIAEPLAAPSRVALPYRPIRDYAVIGDGHGAALVCRDGSIDWCCLGRFDAPPVMARLLDAKRGGYFSLAPAEPVSCRRRYLRDTAILVTQFAAAEGSAMVIDFMPMGCRPGTGLHDYTTINAPGWIVRIVKGGIGRLRFRAAYRPSRGFESAPVKLACAAGLVTGEGIPALQGEADFATAGDAAVADFTIASGETRCFILSAAPSARLDAGGSARRMLAVTAACGPS